MIVERDLIDFLQNQQKLSSSLVYGYFKILRQLIEQFSSTDYVNINTCFNKAKEILAIIISNKLGLMYNKKLVQTIEIEESTIECAIKSIQSQTLLKNINFKIDTAKTNNETYSRVKRVVITFGLYDMYKHFMFKYFQYIPLTFGQDGYPFVNLYILHFSHGIYNNLSRKKKNNDLPTAANFTNLLIEQFLELHQIIMVEKSNL